VEAQEERTTCERDPPPHSSSSYNVASPRGDANPPRGRNYLSDVRGKGLGKGWKKVGWVGKA
jgi:hypothetical protein